MQFGLNMAYLKDGYLIISEAAEVRLRPVALMTPGVRFLWHILEIGIECSISFHIGLKDSVCLNYSPCFLVEHCATTKVQLENLD
jgi:hypothetical protein